MAEEFLTLSDGTYTLSESSDKKVFYFYRNDGKELGDVGRKPMDLYQVYITSKMFGGELDGPVYGNLRFENSSDNKIVRLTVVDFKELDKEESKKDSTDDQKKPKIFERLFGKIWRQKRID